MARYGNLAAWLIINSVKYLKSRDLHQLLSLYKVQEICDFSSERLQSLGFTSKQIQQIIHPDLTFIKHVEAWASESHQHVICYEDEDYPIILTQLPSPPLILYAKGDINLLNETQIAIVGSRNASHYGLDNAFQYGAELARQGFVVTSGFASGVDGHAHQGALSVGGKTIAVLGTGVDIVYPSRHKQLAEQIYQHGLLISEFPPQTPARAQNFPRRNRIISGLSVGVLVVEAALKSGSLITARYALEQNKEIFAIPTSIHDPRGRGCHALIKQGAKLTESVADILDELSLNISSHMQLDFFSEDKKNEKKSNKNFTIDDLLVNLDYEVTTIDQLVSRSHLPVDVILTRLLDLELKGLVATVSGGYVRTRRDEYV